MTWIALIEGFTGFFAPQAGKPNINHVCQGRASKITS